MKKIPDNVEEWSLGTITDIIHDGYEESENLEFKKEVADESERVEKTVCAFANTLGGTIVFGVNDDRSMSLTTRLTGLEDSGQLKRRIVDKIKNIHPNIPLDCLNFKSSNVKSPTPGRVFIILKILPSTIGPHQHNDIFYKRMSDGNEPMSFEEIKNQIISSRRSERMLTMLMSEAGVLDFELSDLKNYIRDKLMSTVLSSVEEYLQYDTFTYFVFNQAYLYDFEVHVSIMRILESIGKMKKARRLLDSMKGASPDFIKDELKKTSTKTPEEYVFKTLSEHIKDIYSNLEIVEKNLNIKRIPVKFPS